MKLKIGDNIIVIAGKDKGKTAKVLRVLNDSGKALVEGVNLVKKHMRRTRDDQKGGVVQMERPVSLSNIMPFCKSCDRPVRVSFSLAADKTKLRLCKRCKQAL